MRQIAIFAALVSRISSLCCQSIGCISAFSRKHGRFQVTMQIRCSSLPIKKNIYISVSIENRLEQSKSDDFLLILQLLETCRIRRFVLICQSVRAVNYRLEPLKTYLESDRETCWPNLIMGCLILPNELTIDKCCLLASSERPSVQWCLGTSVKDASHIADIHYNELVVFNSKVCRLPLAGGD